MNKTKLEKLLKRKESQHFKEEAKREKHAKEHGYAFKPRKLDLGLPWRPRLGMFKSSSGKNYFDPFTCHAVSYDWWSYVVKVKGKVIFNDNRYSVTTSSHQGDVRGLLRNLGIKIDLYVNTRSDIGNQNGLCDALAQKYEALFLNEIVMNRKNSKKESNQYRAKENKELKSEIKALRRLGIRVSRQDIKKISEVTQLNETKRLEKNRVEAIERKKLRQQAKELLDNSFITEINQAA